MLTVAVPPLEPIRKVWPQGWSAFTSKGFIPESLEMTKDWLVILME